MDLPPGFRRQDLLQRDDGSLNHVSENTTAKIDISESVEVEHCPEYPPASAFCYACKNFSLFCWTCFLNVLRFSCQK
jgi:hypothetical protein